MQTLIKKKTKTGNMKRLQMDPKKRVLELREIATHQSQRKVIMAIQIPKVREMTKINRQ